MDTLTMMDRGDCCQAQARVVVGKRDLRLVFCAHHVAKHKAKLLENGWEVLIENFEGLSPKAGVKV